MRITELMTADVAIADPGDAVRDVIARMRTRACSCLVVTRDSVPIGIFTERDVVRVYDEQSLSRQPVAVVMSSPPVVVRETASVDEALSLAEARRIRHLPIVDTHARLIGIVTQTDLARSHRRIIEREVHARTAELTAANQRLTVQQALLNAEEAIAKHVFDQLTVRDAEPDQGLSVWNEPVGTFSGDLLLIGATDAGRRHVLLGDFTGHGLSAALGAVPSASIFHTMSAKGLGMQAIATELNEKLTTLLPVGYFCCACLLEVDVRDSVVRICNRGLPPLYLIDGAGAIKACVESSGLPLGITTSAAASAEWQTATLAPGDRLYACSDGLCELRNAAGEEFGTARVERLLRERGAAPRLARLRDAARVFLGPARAEDDITVVELCLAG